MVDCTLVSKKDENKDHFITKMPSVSAAAAAAAYENADLKKERKTCSFDIEEMTNILDGGADKTAERRELGT